MSNFPNKVPLDLPKPEHKQVSDNGNGDDSKSLREQLLETYQNLKSLCDHHNCEHYRLHILDQNNISDINSLTNNELALLNNMTSGCILAWIV